MGSEPGTGISVAWSSATMFQPYSSAARAGKAASRSRVTVNSPLTMSSGARSLASMSARSSSSVAARISAASLRLTVVAPRMPCSRGRGGVMAHNVAALVRLMLVTDDRLVAGRDLVALARAAEAGGALVGAAPAQVGVRAGAGGARPRAGGRAGDSRAGERPARRGARGRRCRRPPRGRRSAGGAGAAHRPAGFRDRRLGRLRRGGCGERWRPTTGGSVPGGSPPPRRTRARGSARRDSRALVRRAGGRPCLAIGAVRPEDAASVRRAGGAGIAVVSGILAAADARAATAGVRAKLGVSPQVAAPRYCPRRIRAMLRRCSS